MRQSFRTIVAARSILGLLVLSALSLESCSRKSPDAPNPPQNQTAADPSSKPGVMIPSGNLPVASSDSEQITYLGGIITTRVIAGKVYIPVQAALSDASFASLQEFAAAQASSSEQRIATMNAELSSNIAKISKSVSLVNVVKKPEIGYFSGYVALEDYESLAQISDLTQQILINPVIENHNVPRASTLAGSAVGIPQDARSTTEAYSGLERLGVSEFLAITKKEIGEDIDGSTVRVGVTDTGMTLNHPAFENAKGESRVTYMKDFTGEGQIYFAETGTFAAREPEANEIPAGVQAADVVVVTAKYIMTPAGRAVPVADKLSELTAQSFVVPADLKAELLKEGSGARLGVLSEDAFAQASAKEFVDINHNGKVDDVLFAILLPGAGINESRVFLDLAGKGDFRKSIGLRDWNTTKDTVKSYAEKFGFEIKNIELKDSNAKPVRAIAAAIVGFDPGNHGSHVAGIIAARKTIANDTEGTKARGVAPNANIMMNRVCANNAGCAATDALIDLSLNGAEVINMSLGGLSPWNDGYGVEETIINRLSQLKNTLFVISAGNSGPGRQTVGSPSNALRALSVAATATPNMVARQYQYPGSAKTSASSKDEDFVLFFSSRGPNAAGGFKPNLAAPGTELSTVKLNNGPNERPGLDVYWGTSMAAPAATGAITLLIDAAKRYNVKNPDKALPVDNATLHRVLMASARPFDINSYDPKSGKHTQGQYTWIDQGHGMVNLPAAWKALKKERDLAVPSAVVAVAEDGKKTSVALEYEVRVLRKSPNGNDYTGATTGPAPNGATVPRFGRGIYLDMKETDSMISVQVKRKLPVDALARSDAGDLARQLVTTADTFELETVYYGSRAEWIKAGTLASTNCVASPTSRVTIIGEGPADNFSAQGETPRSTAFGASNLNVCLDRALMQTLPPGDHGAIIKAFRLVEGKRAPHPSFEVPVYLSVPHATIAGGSGYHISGTVKSFGVDRNYVMIPAGVSVLRVVLEVPEAKVSGNVVSGCSGVELMMLEGANTAEPIELTSRTAARASNCDVSGAISTKRVVSVTRTNPTPGVWDVHIFGQYQYPDSAYKLSIDFAKVSTSVTKVEGGIDALQGAFEFTIDDSSLKAVPSAKESTYKLSKLVQRQKPEISNKEEKLFPAVDGTLGRKYDESIGTASFATEGLKGSDLDLKVIQCNDAEMTEGCKSVADSAGSTDEELATFTPEKDKFYAPEVTGYQVASVGAAKFDLIETRNVKEAESGALSVVNMDGAKFKVQHTFETASSKILASDLFKTGQWNASGDVTVMTEDKVPLLRVPVEVLKHVEERPADALNPENRSAPADALKPENGVTTADLQ